MAVSALLLASTVRAQANLERTLDSIVSREQARQHIPGLAVYVGKGGTALLSKGYGVADWTRPSTVGTFTVFPIASITKTFTSALVYTLAHRGLVDIGKPIGAYLPDLPAWKDSVTIKHLLTHTSGLVDFWEQPGAAATRYTERSSQELIGLFAKEPLRANPGTWFQYEISSWIVLGALIERVTGKSYPEALQDHVLRPLGLNHTSYCGFRSYPAGNARGYQWDDAGDSLITGDLRGIIGASTSGGVCSSSADLAQFASALLSARLFPASLLTDMTTPPEATRRYGNGAGLFVGTVAGHRMLTHSGSLRAGFQAELFMLPDDSLTIVLLGNQYHANLQALRFEIANVVLGTAREVRDLPLSGEELSRYSGRYPTGGTNRSIFVVQDGRLRGFGYVPLLYQGEHSFVPADDPTMRVVFRVENGQAIRMEIYRDGMLALAGDRARP